MRKIKSGIIYQRYDLTGSRYIPNNSDSINNSGRVSIVIDFSEQIYLLGGSDDKLYYILPPVIYLNYARPLQNSQFTHCSLDKVTEV